MKIKSKKTENKIDSKFVLDIKILCGFFCTLWKHNIALNGNVTSVCCLGLQETGNVCHRKTEV